MSNIKDRLRALKKKKKPEKAPPADSRKASIQRLKSMIRTVEKREAVSEPPQNSSDGLLMDSFVEGPGQDIEDLISGEFLETESGRCFRVKTVYPWQFHQGNIPVSSLLDLEMTPLGMVVDDARIQELDIRKALFFDTETTGLDTGAGTYIFLAGFGYYSDRSFIVEQFFMRDFPEEHAVLHAISDLLKRFDSLITYNGKTYDWPLLESRFIINRLPIPKSDPLHLDLLHLVRRLYRYRFIDCKLPSVETNLLGFRRVDDLPGALLPELYFKYIRTRDARQIHRAFSHNAHDIVSLAAAMVPIIQFLANPFSQDNTHGSDLYAFARIAEKRNDHSTAETAFKAALNLGVDPVLYRDGLTRLSLIYKRMERWPEAREVWELLKQAGASDDPFPYEEIAKYLEHHKKDFTSAVEIVRCALYKLKLFGYTGQKNRRQLEHRLRRLTAKINGERWYGVTEDEN